MHDYYGRHYRHIAQREGGYAPPSQYLVEEEVFLAISTVLGHDVSEENAGGDFCVKLRVPLLQSFVQHHDVGVSRLCGQPRNIRSVQDTGTRLSRVSEFYARTPVSTTHYFHPNLAQSTLFTPISHSSTAASSASEIRALLPCPFAIPALLRARKIARDSPLRRLESTK